jgi:3-deoxy-D-arabino-heptulosonate 7-phosphate (DAHP) synthase
VKEESVPSSAVVVGACGTVAQAFFAGAAALSNNKQHIKCESDKVLVLKIELFHL